MTDTVNTLDQLNRLFQSITMSILGLDPTTWNAYQTALTALKTVAVSAQTGNGYQVADVLAISGGTGGTFIVDTVDGTGAVLTGHIGAAGTGYSTGNNVSTTGGNGAGCKVNITAVNTWTDPVPTNPYYNARIGWQPEGAPAWKQAEDVFFVRCFEVDHPYNRQREVFNSNNDDGTINQATGYTRINSVMWTFYGPNSYDNARKVRTGLFYQQNHDTLEKSKVYLVPDIIAPRRVPEVWPPNVGQWWERVDLTINFNELVIENLTIDSIASATVSLYSEDGAVDTITAQ